MNQSINQSITQKSGRSRTHRSRLIRSLIHFWTREAVTCFCSTHSVTLESLSLGTSPQIRFTATLTVNVDSQSPHQSTLVFTKSFTTHGNHTPADSRSQKVIYDPRSHPRFSPSQNSPHAEYLFYCSVAISRSQHQYSGCHYATHDVYLLP